MADPSDDLEDVLLVGRIAARDAAAFAAFYDRQASRALGLLLRMLGDRPEAEDVLQEVFLQVWQQADRFRPQRSSPRGWVLLLARSRALDRLRSRQARRRREERTAADRGDDRSEAAGTERLEAEERAERLGSALEGLPGEQRRAIELAFFEGLTQSEIAARVGAPLPTVKSRVLLGMNKLRHAFGAGP